MFEHDHLQALIGCRDLETPDGTAVLIAIIFRGSDDVLDWLHNLDFRKVRFLDRERFPQLVKLKVHKGIMENVLDFEHKALRIVSQNGAIKGSLAVHLTDASKRKQCFFWIVGHSLGGAMAALFAARLYEYYQAPSERILTHTFGAPPIGNRSFAAHYGHDEGTGNTGLAGSRPLLKVIRFVNTDDPIPAPHVAVSTRKKERTVSIPRPPYRLLGFKHFGREVRFTPGSLAAFRESFKMSTGKPYRSSNFMDAHFMEAYLAGVDALRRSGWGRNEKT
jgi:hypothetical protein